MHIAITEFSRWYFYMGVIDMQHDMHNIFEKFLYIYSQCIALTVISFFIRSNMEKKKREFVN